MTLTEKIARLNSTHNLAYTVGQKADAVLGKDWEQFKVLCNLQRKLNRAWDDIAARPHECQCDDGKWLTIVGLLPNGEETSTDEAEALRMLTAYRAAKAFEIPEYIEVPF